MSPGVDAIKNDSNNVDRSLTEQQVRFLEIPDQLAAHGVIEPEALYQPPLRTCTRAGRISCSRASRT
jgi:hypothetical protein